MINFDNWLNEEIEVTRQFENPKKIPRYEYISFLMTANGGPVVQQWGFISSGVGDFPHQRGLDQNDALSLMQFSAFIDGLIAADVNVDVLFNKYLPEYVDNFKRAYNANRN